MLSIILPVLTSVAPVFAFLGLLNLFDSYELMKFRSIALAIFYGSAIAFLAGGINYWMMGEFHNDTSSYIHYAAPAVEEFLKAAFIFYVIYRGKAGFMIDSAIYGFSVGAGFAFIENLYYINTVVDPHPTIWIIRGFGTAIMHGGTSAIFGIIFKVYSNREVGNTLTQALPGFLIAVFIHWIYNQILFTPLINTLGVLIVLPLVFSFIFIRGEKSLQRWLGTGFDSDMEMLSLLNEGKVSESKAGEYLISIRSKFPPLVVLDMIMLLKIHLELSIRAKAVLMSREAGIAVKPTDEIREKFVELNQLEKNIGQTGLLTISPFLHTSKRDLWELHMLDSMQ